MPYSKKELVECAHRRLEKLKTSLPAWNPKWTTGQRTSASYHQEEIDRMQAVYRVLIALPDDFIHNSQA